MQNNDCLGVWFGNASNISQGYKGPNIGFKADCNATLTERHYCHQRFFCTCAHGLPVLLIA